MTEAESTAAKIPKLKFPNLIHPHDESKTQCAEPPAKIPKLKLSTVIRSHEESKTQSLEPSAKIRKLNFLNVIRPHDESKTQSVELPSMLPKLEYLNLSRLHDEIKTQFGAIEFCQGFGLIPTLFICGNCETKTEKIYETRQGGDRPTRFCFKCTRKACAKAQKSSCSIKKNTWFDNSHISFECSLKLVYCFIKKDSLERACEETDSSQKTVREYYNYCREICGQALLREGVNEKIGGSGCTVDVDVSKFESRKFHRGQFVKGQWVVAGICRETSEKFYLCSETHKEETVFDLIINNVETGSKVVTDSQRGYSTAYLQANGFVHETVNYRESGTNTSSSDSTWWAVKRSLPTQHINKFFFDKPLAEYIYRSTRERKGLFEAFLHDIGKVFPGGP